MTNRITKVTVQTDVEHGEKPIRVTKEAVNVDIKHGYPVIVRITKAAVQVEITQPWARERYGPRVQVI